LECAQTSGSFSIGSSSSAVAQLDDAFLRSAANISMSAFLTLAIVLLSTSLVGLTLMTAEPAMRQWKKVLASISEPDTEGVSTIRVTVAVEETDPTHSSSLISTLNRLALDAPNASRERLRTLTYAVALELLQRSSSLEYASRAYKHTSDRDTGNNR
jgi:hypothetical protein